MSSTSEYGASTGASPEPTVQDGRAAAIAKLAYEKWNARGCPDGDDLRDWYEAEQEVLATAATQPSASPPARNRKRA